MLDTSTIPQFISVAPWVNIIRLRCRKLGRTRPNTEMLVLYAPARTVFAARDCESSAISHVLASMDRTCAWATIPSRSCSHTSRKNPRHCRRCSHSIRDAWPISVPLPAGVACGRSMADNEGPRRCGASLARHLTMCVHPTADRRPARCHLSRRCNRNRKNVYRHEERLAKIELGIDPDEILAAAEVITGRFHGRSASPFSDQQLRACRVASTLAAATSVNHRKLGAVKAT